jgi:nitroreductase
VTKPLRAILALSLLAPVPALAQNAQSGQNRASAQSPMPQNQPDALITVQGERRRPTHDWLRAQSQHFIVYTNRRRTDADQLLRRMEAFHRVLRLSIGLPAQDTARPARTTLYYLSDERDLARVLPGGPDQAIGAYATCADGVVGLGVDLTYVGATREPLEKQPENEGLSYVFAAYARHFWYNHAMQRAPVWFVEGLAHFFSTARFEEDEAVIGMAPTSLATIMLSPAYHALDFPMSCWAR